MDFIRRLVFPAKTGPDPSLTMDSNLKCPREKTVKGMVEILDEYRILHVRGTPASGKTVLSCLLYDYYKTQNVPVIWKGRWTGDEGDWRFYFAEMFRDEGHDFVNHSNIDSIFGVIILDEAQMSYGDSGLWLGMIKSQSGNPWGPRVAIFTSYGSPTTALEESPYLGSPLAYLGSHLRISITPSNLQFSPKIALFYDREEYDDVVSRYCGDSACLLKLDEKTHDYIYSLTSGHPGAVHGVLRMLTKVYHSDLKRNMKIVCEADIRKALDDKDKAFAFLRETPANRSFVVLQNLNPHAANTLRRVLIEGSIPRDLENEGVRICYQRGWVHTEAVDQYGAEIICVLPSNLHAKFVEYHLADPKVEFPREKYPDIKSLAEATLRQFSRRNMRAVTRYGVGAVIRPVEATYQDEFYRSLHTVLGYAMDVTSEWSPDGVGRIDFRLGSVGWGIELLREGDRLHEHCQRFTIDGSYGKWIQQGHLKDCLVIDCRTSTPRAYETPNAKLWRAVFSPDFSDVEVWDQHNQVMVNRFALTE